MFIKWCKCSTTSVLSLFPGLRSTQSDPNLQIGICQYDLVNFVWKNGATEVPQVGDFLYVNSTGSAGTFNGGNNYWHYEPSIAGPDPISYSIQVSTGGEITYAAPCNA